MSSIDTQTDQNLIRRSRRAVGFSGDGCGYRCCCERAVTATGAHGEVVDLYAGSDYDRFTHHFAEDFMYYTTHAVCDQNCSNWKSKESMGYEILLTTQADLSRLDPPPPPPQISLPSCGTTSCILHQTVLPPAVRWDTHLGTGGALPPAGNRR